MNTRFNRIVSLLGLCLALLAVGIVPAMAQEPPAVDYTALGTSTRNGIVDAVNDVAPIAFGLLALMIGVGIAWKFLKRGAKSS